MMRHSAGIALGLALALGAAAAPAQWLPRLSSPWPLDATHPLSVRNVEVDADDRAFVGFAYQTGSFSEAAVARFDANGSVAWAKVGGSVKGDGLAPSILLANDRIAVVGEYLDTLGEPVEKIFIEVRERSTGALVWNAETNDASIPLDERYVTRASAQTSNGDILIRADDDDEFLMLRYDQAGNSLPAWRWACDANGVVQAGTANIVATEDGGAVVVGSCGFGTGIHTVRLDAAGSEMFHDIELGANNGVFLSAGFLGVDADGATIIAAATESLTGVPQGLVWKLAADGTRLWTTYIPVISPFGGADVNAFVLAANGDAVVAMQRSGDPPRVVRLDHATGAILWDSSPLAGARPTGLVEASNGRILLADSAYVQNPDVPTEGHQVGTITEFTADGALCRQTADLGMDFPRVAASSDEWVVAGFGRLDPGSEHGALIVHRFDIDGPCNFIFVDGFDATTPNR